MLQCRDYRPNAARGLVPEAACCRLKKYHAPLYKYAQHTRKSVKYSFNGIITTAAMSAMP